MDGKEPFVIRLLIPKHALNLVLYLSNPMQRARVTKDSDQNNRLLVTRWKISIWLYLFILALLLFMSYKIWQDRTRIIEDFQNIETAPIAILTFLLAWIFIFTTMLWRYKPSLGSKQVFNSWQRVVKNIALVLFSLPFIIVCLEVIQKNIFPQGWSQGPIFMLEDQSYDASDLVGISLICLVILLVAFFFIFKLFSTFWLAIDHGKVTAHFDQSQYYPGQEIKVTIKDRLSNSSKLKYRVFLNQVHENRDNKGYHHRYFSHSDYIDCTAKELSEGLSFSLPESVPDMSMPTDFTDHLDPRYWEILVEEINGWFWARFFIDVKES